jgi:omega-6 fatty acid desaturase (delta-12 desaturase)
MFLLGPLFITLITHRIPISVKDKKERNSVYLTNLFFLLILASMSLAIGSFNLIIVYLLVLYLGLIGGIWLFYVQHQFEDVYWARSEKWNFIEASLKGGSYYKLPKVINWFTGNIGYHHVHHLISRIPNYNLPYSHKKTPINKIVKPVKLFRSLKSLKFRLWDEQQGRLVSFREARKIYGKIITS